MNTWREENVSKSIDNLTLTLDWCTSYRERERMQHPRRVAVEQRSTYVTALVPSDTACLASSPGRSNRTAVWISRDEIV